MGLIVGILRFLYISLDKIWIQDLRMRADKILRYWIINIDIDIYCFITLTNSNPF